MDECPPPKKSRDRYSRRETENRTIFKLNMEFKRVNMDFRQGVLSKYCSNSNINGIQAYDSFISCFLSFSNSKMSKLGQTYISIIFAQSIARNVSANGMICPIS